ncbi:MAG: YkgJ family cysteine cluster protein [Deltaproteobacteria bacterium]|nr:YkgJ family cysteine cluster protein [Deltaproteobacteria bacterium]
MGSLPGLHRFISSIAHKTYAPFLDRLTIIFATMDKAYQEAADYYHFHCTGCENSCCFTRFYHHTLLEYFFVLEGYKSLSHQKQVEIEQRAWDVCRKTDEADKKGEPVRLMCPFNVDGLCLTYDFRPMICRLHGIPHELHGSDRSVMQGRGCDVFYKQCSPKEPFRFDRTPFYVNMANLERELRQTVGVPNKMKMTIAEMITTFEPHQ